MLAETNFDIEEAKKRLSQLTSKMDVPTFRTGSIVWLDKNLAARNSNHKDYPAARQLIDELIKRGVR